MLISTLFNRLLWHKIPILASVGVLGIIRGLAAQEALRNPIAGIALYFDNTYKIGDAIVPEDEQ